MNWKRFEKHFEPQRIFAYSGLILVVTIIILAIVENLNKAYEMKREELIAYDKWLTRRKWGTGEIISPEKAADLYLAEHPLPPAGGAEEILAKGKVLMFGHVIVDPIMLPEGIYATKELRIYLPETTIEHLLETGKSFRDKTQTRWLLDSYFDNLSKCELIDVDVVRDATLHAQRLADKMVEERCAKCEKR